MVFYDFVSSLLGRCGICAAGDCDSFFIKHAGLDRQEKSGRAARDVPPVVTQIFDKKVNTILAKLSTENLLFRYRDSYDLVVSRLAAGVQCVVKCRDLHNIFNSIPGNIGIGPTI